MQKRNGLPKPERLSSGSRIDALFNGGRRGVVGPLRFCWTAFPAEPEPGVSVLFSVPKKAFKRAWKRNLIKRRMRESYRQRKHELAEAAEAAGRRIDIALICVPEGMNRAKGERAKEMKAGKGRKEMVNGGQETAVAKKAGGAATTEAPDFKTIDNAVAKILEKITAQNKT